MCLKRNADYTYVFDVVCFMSVIRFCYLCGRWLADVLKKKAHERLCGRVRAGVDCMTGRHALRLGLSCVLCRAVGDSRVCAVSMLGGLGLGPSPLYVVVCGVRSVSFGLAGGVVVARYVEQAVKFVFKTGYKLILLLVYFFLLAEQACKL